MKNAITQLLIIALAIIPFCNGIVQVIKTSINIPSRFIPLISVVCGIVIGALFKLIAGDYDFTQLLIAGGIAGMSSCSVYDVISRGSTKKINHTNKKKVDIPEE
jgi:Na+-transporting NADH:ubiquinone oxidoreductase subunit NqrE